MCRIRFRSGLCAGSARMRRSMGNKAWDGDGWMGGLWRTMRTKRCTGKPQSALRVFSTQDSAPLPLGKGVAEEL
jgi:hypothetical protein